VRDRACVDDVEHDAAHREPLRRQPDVEVDEGDTDPRHTPGRTTARIGNGSGG
jgi:hypothetical protein